MECTTLSFRVTLTCVGCTSTSHREVSKNLERIIYGNYDSKRTLTTPIEIFQTFPIGIADIFIDVVANIQIDNGRKSLNLADDIINIFICNM